MINLVFMDKQPIDELATFFKALADANRLRIVGFLAQKEATGEELAAVLGLHPATISHHMGRLRAAGLVEARAESYYSVYKLRPDVIQSLAKQLFSTAGLALVSADLDADAYDKKVLDDFMTSSGRLKTIPAQRKKRNVILRHIVGELKPGHRYSERQINNVLKRYHADTALLRREMVAEKLLARHGGLYWRVDSGGPPWQVHRRFSS
jgi:biotin operon repressor